MPSTRTMGTTLTKTKSGAESVDLLIGGLTSIGEIGLESDEIDTTTLDSPNEFKEFIAGNKDAGEVSLAGNIKSEATVAKLLALANARTVEVWTVAYPSGAKWVFSGFVKMFKDTEKSIDGVAGFTATIRVSGATVYTPAV